MTIQTVAAPLVILVELANHESVGKITFGVDGNPNLEISGEIRRSGQKLKEILNRLKGLELSVPVAAQPEKQTNGNIIIRDRVKYCSPGDTDYPYALAHELSHHTHDGILYSGIVKRIGE